MICSVLISAGAARADTTPAIVIFHAAKVPNSNSFEQVSYTAPPSPARVIATPGPTAAAGLVPLLGVIGAFLFARRRR